MNNLNEFELNPELLGEVHEFENNEGEITHEVMEISNEQEFEYFLGNIWNSAKQLYNSPQGQAIKKDFVSGAKSFGKKMLPSLGRNLGNYVGGSQGGKYGGQIANAASNWIFGEANEHEVADYLKVVRKAAKYLNRALAQGSVPTDNPRSLITAAINQAARPILSQRRESNSSSNSSQNQGRWIRQGNKIIVQGAN